jgi:hypothetical protein
MNAFPGRRRSILAQKGHMTVTADDLADPIVVITEPVSLAGVHDCPKCGKHMKRGMVLHYKHCKGKQ